MVLQVAVIQRVFGLLIMIFSLSIVPPILVSLWYDDTALMAFIQAAAFTMLLGIVLWLPVRRARAELRLRDGFIVVVLFWSLLGLIGAIPLYLADEPDMSATDAVFESLSALTTTGATVIVGLDSLPESILFYRQMLQWLGGMGIIVLAVAILPMLGVGGMQLYRAETPGPVKDAKLTPRINQTAKTLWFIYLGMTIACALAYWAAGMTLFDAVSHSFSTVAIGGFSTHDASMGYFNSHVIEMICVVFMLLAGMNFALHFTAFRRVSLAPYIEDEEARTYLLVLLIASLITVGFLWYASQDFDFSEAFWHGVFQAVSIGTTTGFTTTSYFIWPSFLPVMLILISFIGGCAGSTGGGIKVVRFLMLMRQGQRELQRLLHPRAFLDVKIGRRPMSERVIEAVWGFFSAYIGIFVIMLLLLMASGLDQITAFSAVAACINNLGPGLGAVGVHYGDINSFAKWVLCMAMLLGRLEIFTLFVLLTPSFWRS